MTTKIIVKIWIDTTVSPSAPKRSPKALIIRIKDGKKTALSYTGKWISKDEGPYPSECLLPVSTYNKDNDK